MARSLIESRTSKRFLAASVDSRGTLLFFVGTSFITSAVTTITACALPLLVTTTDPEVSAAAGDAPGMMQRSRPENVKSRTMIPSVILLLLSVNSLRRSFAVDCLDLFPGYTDNSVAKSGTGVANGNPGGGQILPSERRATRRR